MRLLLLRRVASITDASCCQRTTRSRYTVTRRARAGMLCCFVMPHPNRKPNHHNATVFVWPSAVPQYAHSPALPCPVAHHTAPTQPPAFMMLSPNGRFETGIKICLSISSHHPEHWQPSWSVRTALTALVAFLPTPGGGALGALVSSGCIVMWVVMSSCALLLRRGVGWNEEQ